MTKNADDAVPLSGQVVYARIAQRTAKASSDMLSSARRDADTFQRSRPLTNADVRGIRSAVKEEMDHFRQAKDLLESTALRCDLAHHVATAHRDVNKLGLKILKSLKPLCEDGHVAELPTAVLGLLDDCIGILDALSVAAQQAQAIEIPHTSFDSLKSRVRAFISIVAVITVALIAASRLMVQREHFYILTSCLVLLTLPVFGVALGLVTGAQLVNLYGTLASRWKGVRKHRGDQSG